VSPRAPTSRPPWRDLFDDSALHRIARLASLHGEEQLVWLGAGGDKLAKQLEKICEGTVKVRPDLEGVPKRSLGLIVAPEIVGQVGLEKALKELRGVLETDGVLAVVMAAAVGDGPPDAERAEWERQQHGPLDSVMEAMSRFSALGIEPLTAELLSAKAGAERSTDQDSAAAEPPAGSGGRASLGLFVGRRVEAGSPPRWPHRAGME